MKLTMGWLKEYRFLFGAVVVAVAYAVVTQTGLLQGSHPTVGHAAPVFSVEQLEGGFIDLEKHRGNEVVVLDFWSVYCPPCRKGLPILERAGAEFAGQPVRVYGINIMDPPEAIRAFLAEIDVDLPIGVDAFGDLANLYGVQGIPHTVVIRADGIVQDVHVGVGGFERWLRRAIGQALDESVAAAAPVA